MGIVEAPETVDWTRWRVPVGEECRMVGWAEVGVVRVIAGADIVLKVMLVLVGCQCQGMDPGQMVGLHVDLVIKMLGYRGLRKQERLCDLDLVSFSKITI